MGKRNWLVEDNLVALYIALYGYEYLGYDLKGIREIIPHTGFRMRIKNYIAINTKGEKGLVGGLKSPLYNKLYGIFKRFDQKDFAKIVNLILEVKSKVMP